MKPYTLSPRQLEGVTAALAAASTATAQLLPLQQRTEEALRRSRELLSLPVYPYDSIPSR